jgi:hypothetical protein
MHDGDVCRRPAKGCEAQPRKKRDHFNKRGHVAKFTIGARADFSRQAIGICSGGI